jgi:hypothetical protein
VGLALLVACSAAPPGSDPGGPGPGGGGPVGGNPGGGGAGLPGNGTGGGGGLGPGQGSGGGGALPLPPPPSFCAGSGPIFDLGNTAAPPPGTCDSDTFAAAICSCSDLKVKGYVAVASTDPALPTAGSLGTNGNTEVLGYASVGGSVAVAGDHPLGFYGYLRAGGNLDVNGRVAVQDSGFAAGYMEVGGDTRVDGAIALLGYAALAGDLTQPAGAGTPIVMNVGGARIAAPVDVAPPCACRDDQIPDLGGFVADTAQQNDNATVGLAPGALKNVVGFATRTLPCGHYYLDEISGAGFIHVKVTGRVALAIGGDVNPTGLLAFEVAPGAELDLVIGGSLRATGAGGFATFDAPGSMRVYVNGGGDLKITGAAGFNGNLYAPRANILGTGATFVNGSLFGRRIEIPGFLQVGYDPGVQGDCEPQLPPPSEPPIPPKEPLPNPS